MTERPSDLNNLPDFAEFDTPIILVSDGSPIRILPTTHEQIIATIRQWVAGLYASRAEAVSFEGLRDRYRMAEAAITLIETDEATGISLETFGPVGDLVSRVVAYAFGHDPAYTTVHWPVH